MANCLPATICSCVEIGDPNIGDQPLLAASRRERSAQTSEGDVRKTGAAGMKRWVGRIARSEGASLPDKA
jgi:hypothetical protein